MTEKRKVLGRGLETLLPPRQFPNTPLIPGGGTVTPGETVQEIPLDHLDANPYQTRTKLDEHSLDELVESIDAMGVIQPIVVRPAGNGRYQVVAGERRVKASYMAAKTTIPAIVRQISNQQAMEMTIIENLQREDINTMDQAHAFQRLSTEFQLTQEEIAKRTGKDRSTVANYLRLLKLPQRVQDLLRDDRLSFGHAKVLLGLPVHSPQVIIDLAERAVSLSVRRTEQEVTNLIHPPEREEKAEREVDPNVEEAENQLKKMLGMQVRIVDRNGKGRIIIEYQDLEDFDRIMQLLG